MFQVAENLPIAVIAPVPWFPLQRLLRVILIYPHYRPKVPLFEQQNGIPVYHPKFFCIPYFGKNLDCLFMALSIFPLMRRLKREIGFELIDAHFIYPDGVAAWLLGRWLKVPITITLRGQITRITKTRIQKSLCVAAMRAATKVFSVADFLRRGVIEMGINPEHIQVIANGVNLARFKPADPQIYRRKLGLSADAKVLISVGWLTEGKGFHRVIELLPKLRQQFPNLHYIIAGGPSSEGNWEAYLKDQVRSLGLATIVHFLGPVEPQELYLLYSSGNVFVLATRIEGWANVFLEAMACGLPVITTNVGGNPEVVISDDVGVLVPFGDSDALYKAIEGALMRIWDRNKITTYARANAWETRIPILVSELQRIIRGM
jgi:teichuronic acid biosynthesis glycosyltransferase TuaC